MIDKKTSVIAVLCVVTVLCLGLWANEAQEASRLKGELYELEVDYEKLARVRTSLEEGYSELRTEKEDLEIEYSTLENDYFDLDDEKDTLETEYSIIKSEYDSLEGNYSKLEREYSWLISLYDTLFSNHISLKRDYDDLNSLFEEGKAIAESAEWITEDERLKVTSELIPEYLFGGIIGYKVRVTITNIGNELIDEAWMFLFPYVDGNLYEYWNPIGNIHSIESLCVGETYSYDFTWITKDMTSYKVLAIVG